MTAPLTYKKYLPMEVLYVLRPTEISCCRKIEAKRKLSNCTFYASLAMLTIIETYFNFILIIIF